MDYLCPELDWRNPENRERILYSVQWSGQVQNLSTNPFFLPIEQLYYNSSSFLTEQNGFSLSMPSISDHMTGLYSCNFTMFRDHRLKTKPHDNGCECRTSPDLVHPDCFDLQYDNIVFNRVGYFNVTVTEMANDTAPVASTQSHPWKVAAIYFAARRGMPWVAPGNLSLDFGASSFMHRVVRFAVVPLHAEMTLSCDVMSWVPMQEPTPLIRWYWKNRQGEEVQLTGLYNGLQFYVRRFSLIINVTAELRTTEIRCEPVSVADKSCTYHRHVTLAWCKGADQKRATLIYYIEVTTGQRRQGKTPSFWIQDKTGNIIYSDVLIKRGTVTYHLDAVACSSDLLTRYGRVVVQCWAAEPNKNATLKHVCVFDRKGRDPRGCRLCGYTLPYALTRLETFHLTWRGFPARNAERLSTASMTVKTYDPKPHVSVKPAISTLSLTTPVVMTLTTDSSDDFDIKTTTVIGSVLSLFLLIAMVIGGWLVQRKYHRYRSHVTSETINMAALRAKKQVSIEFKPNVLYYSDNEQYRCVSDTESDFMSELSTTYLTPSVRIMSTSTMVTNLVSQSDYDIIPADQRWEFPREKLELGPTIGCGAFGIVKVAKARDIISRGETTRVAVKMLKDDATDDELRHLLSEMWLMKEISDQYHPNVINLLGCCTQGYQPVYIIMELAEIGNLRDVLRACRSHVRPVGVTSSAKESLLSHVNVRSLVEFALQVVRGMIHIISLNVIHRDLAARNVLVTKDLTMKICDFGLTRKTPVDRDYYRKVTTGRVAWKWLAPEAWKEGKYSVKSDVWSFGVLMWEIFSLGCPPYPVTDFDILQDALTTGYRMARPVNANARIYQVMLRTWDFVADNRPNFAEIEETLADILHMIEPDERVQLPPASEGSLVKEHTPPQDCLLCDGTADLLVHTDVESDYCQSSHSS